MIRWCIVLISSVCLIRFRNDTSGNTFTLVSSNINNSMVFDSFYDIYMFHDIYEIPLFILFSPYFKILVGWEKNRKHKSKDDMKQWEWLQDNTWKTRVYEVISLKGSHWSALVYAVGSWNLSSQISTFQTASLAEVS